MTTTDRSTHATAIETVTLLDEVRMICFGSGVHRFQLRAAALFIRHDAVLLHRLEGDGFWALPGGRVELGESASSAVEREMREELDEEVICGALVCVVENFFQHAGIDHHEIGLCFDASLRVGSPLLDMTRAHRGVEGNRTLEYRWFALSGLVDLDLRPSFLREYLGEPNLPFKHVAQRD